MATSIDIKIRQDFLRLKTLASPPETDEDGCLFLNELDGKPKFREPNNGLIHSFLLDRYRSKNCVYQSNNDDNGIFYWTGTDYGARNWELPYFNPVQINSSSAIASYPGNDVFDLIKRQESFFSTDDLPFGQIQFVVNTAEAMLLRGIYIQSPLVDTYGFMQTYNIYGIDVFSGESYNLYQASDDTRFLGVNNGVYIPFPNNVSFTHSATIIQTGPNSINTNHLCLGQVELYGLFK